MPFVQTVSRTGNAVRAIVGSGLSVPLQGDGWPSGPHAPALAPNWHTRWSSTCSAPNAAPPKSHAKRYSSPGRAVSVPVSSADPYGAVRSKEKPGTTVVVGVPASAVLSKVASVSPGLAANDVEAVRKFSIALRRRSGRRRFSHSVDLNSALSHGSPL